MRGVEREGTASRWWASGFSLPPPSPVRPIVVIPIACAVSNGPGPIADGWNRPDLHDKLVTESERLLPLVAKAGIIVLAVWLQRQNQP